MERLASATDAVQALSRLLRTGIDAGGPDTVRRVLVEETRRFFGVPTAALVPTWPGGRPPAADPAPSPAARSLLLLPLRGEEGAAEWVLLLADERERDFSPHEVEVAAAFAGAAESILVQLALGAELAERVAQQSALARAAQSLNESLDLPRVLARIGREAASIVEADVAAVWRGDAEHGVTLEAVHGLPPEAIGYRLGPGEGVAGRVVQRGQAVLANDYSPLVPPDSPFSSLESVLGVPMRWDGELHGVLAVGYARSRAAGERQLRLLETFAELASVACRNASVHAGLAQAGRTDALTGCLNRAALHETLQNEIERCRRSGHGLALVLLDLDDFKELNERHGHRVGDEVLRRTGHALRHALRPYDHLARYGGDEFAIVAVDAGETEADEVARRSISRLDDAAGELRADWPPERGAAAAGVAEWDGTVDAGGLIAAADRALLYAKQEDGPRRVVAASELPPSFHPGRFRHRHEQPPTPPAGEAPWPASGHDQIDRLRKRSRQLVLANALGARLAGMTAVDRILDSAVVELHRAFGYSLCAILRLREDGYVEAVARRWARLAPEAAAPYSQPRSAGIIGRALRERRPVLVPDVTVDPDYRGSPETAETRSELCVPLWVGGEQWGAINLEEVEPGAFDEDDARLIQTVADQVGSALHSALLYERLERAYDGTAEALAAALDAKDSYTASHSRSVVEHALAVGRRLELREGELRALRYGAIFHDIGKIAVPEAILNKRGPLSAEERAVVERHTVVGERILAPVEFLADARALVRHAHERWDGNGYPDGLRGEQSPLGARIVMACDAYEAMTSKRPYRGAMSEEEARAELRRCAGSQFDPRVVDALEAALGDGLAGQPGVY